MNKVVASPIFTISYNGKDITRDIAKYLEDLSYKDTVEGEASELKIKLEDVDALWRNGWYPAKGSTLKCSIGDMDCGELIIEEVEGEGPPAFIEIKAVSSLSDVPKNDGGVSTALFGKIRTKKSKAYTNKSLSQIAQDVANANGFTIQGSVPNITIKRITQRRETDLKFLRKISLYYGIIFRVMNKKLIFLSQSDVERRDPVLTITPQDVTFYRFRDKTFETYKKAKVRSHYQSLKGVVTETSEATNRDNIPFPQITGGDSYVVHKRVEDSSQASSIANAILYRKNMETMTGSLTMPGRKDLLAGNNVHLAGFGSAYDGIYHLLTVDSTVNRSMSWSASLSIKRVSDKENAATKKHNFGGQAKKVKTSVVKSEAASERDNNSSYPQVDNSDE